MIVRQVARRYKQCNCAAISRNLAIVDVPQPAMETRKALKLKTTQKSLNILYHVFYGQLRLVISIRDKIKIAGTKDERSDRVIFPF